LNNYTNNLSQINALKLKQIKADITLIIGRQLELQRSLIDNPANKDERLYPQLITNGEFMAQLVKDWS